MNKQKGLTLTGMIMVSIVIVMILLLAFKVIPVYTEYSAIENNFKAMSMDPKLRGGNRNLIIGAWAARASVDNLHSLPMENIEVTKEGDGLVISAEYEKRVPLYKEVMGLYFNLKPSSR